MSAEPSFSQHIRRAGADDEPRILTVLRELLPGEDLEARLRWLYRGKPDGPAHAWLAIDDATGEPAGITTFFLRRMQSGTRPILGALGGDMFVRPRFRRRGIGKQLFLAARAEMAALGIDVMFGTPMPANETPLKTSGSTLDGRVVRYARPLSGRGLGLPGPLASVVTPLLRRSSSRLRVEPSPPGDARIDERWQATRGELGVATVRDTRFYQWRFHESPSRVQRPFVVLDGDRVVAACALETLERRVRIVDLVAPASDWPTALTALVAHARDADVLEIKLAHDDGQRRQLWRHGFLARDDKPMSVLTPPGSPLERELHDPSRWFFTWADADTDRPI